MALGDSYRDDLLTAIADRAATPAAPSVPKFSAWSAIPRGIGEAGVQVGATLSDAAASFRYMRDATPEQRKQIDRQGVPIEQFSSASGDAARDFGKTFRSDPETASTAEQVLYGFARGASKIVAGAVVGGLPGILAAGVEEGITQSDELRRQGVDLQTRSNVGLVQGAGLALAALPAAGATLKGTAALYLAGGPGGFVAQQALTREILRNAGHDKLAEQYDPFDPVGLAVSALIPAPFAFYGLRGARKAAAVKAAEDFKAGPVPSEPTAVAGAVREAYSPEVVDAAMVLHSQERRAASSVSRADDAPTTAAHEAALTKAEDQIARGEPVQVADVAPRYITPAERDANFKAWAQDAPLIPAMSGHTFKTGQPVVADAFHGTARDFDSFSNLALGEKTGGADAKAGHFLADNPSAADQFTWENGDKSGHIMPAYVRLLNPFVSDHFLNGSTGTAAGKIIEEAKRAGHDGVIFPRSDMLGNEGATFVAFDPKQIKSATGNSGRFDPTSASLTDPLADFSAALRSIQEARTDAPTAPQAPSPEAAAPARGAGDATAGAAVPEPGRAGADVQAAGLDALQRLNEPAGKPAKPAGDPLMATVAARVADLEKSQPDLVVRMDADGNHITAAQEMAEARKLAARGTDDSLGTIDADLIRVAAECALATGG
jgi:hypothetical protein